MKVYIQEDNSGPLILARTLPQKYTPHSKYYETNTIWFHEDINKRKIVLLKIETVEQLGDLFTKGLPRSTFEFLQNEIMRWKFYPFSSNIMFEK